MKKLIKNAILLTTIFCLCFGFRVLAVNRTLVSQQVYTDENGEQMRNLKYSDGSTDEFDLTVDDYLISEKDENGIRYSTYANGDTSNVYIDQINEYSSFTKQYGPIIKGCDFVKDESGKKIVDADGSRYISKIRFIEKAGGGELALDKSEYLKVGKYDHFRLIALKYAIPIRFKDGIYTQWMADRDNGFKGKLIQAETDEKYEKEYAKQESKEAIYDDFKKSLNEYNETYLSTKEMMSATSEAAAKAREIKDSIKEKIKKISSDNHAIDSNVQGAYDKFMVEYNKTKDSNSIFDLGIITMKIIMEGEYGTNWDPAYIKCLKENNGNWTSHTTMNVKWTKGDGLIHKFNITEEWFGLKYLYGWIMTNEEYNEILSEVKTRCVESYEELISTKYPKALGDERKKIWHRYSMYIGGASFRNELDSFCKEYEKTIEANQDAIDKRNANKEEVYNKLEEYDKE